MKSNTIIPLLVTLFATIGCSNNKEYNYGIEYMHGNVKSVDLSVFEAKAKFGEAIEGELFETQHFIFNTNHQIEQLKLYMDEMEDISTTVIKFKYDSYNNLQVVNIYDFKGDLYGIHECQYSNGKIKKCDMYEYYNCTKEKEKWRTIHYSFSGTHVIADIIEKYDKFTYDIKYGHKGKIVQAAFKDVKSTNSRTTLVERDNDGNILKTTNTYNDHDGMFLFDIIHPYWIYTLGPIASDFSYDKYFERDENAYLYEYEFDEHKNWTKRIVYENDKEHPQYIYKRSIEYYE